MNEKPIAPPLPPQLSPSPSPAGSIVQLGDLSPPHQAPLFTLLQNERPSSSSESEDDWFVPCGEVNPTETGRMGNEGEGQVEGMEYASDRLEGTDRELEISGLRTDWRYLAWEDEEEEDEKEDEDQVGQWIFELGSTPLPTLHSIPAARAKEESDQHLSGWFRRSCSTGLSEREEEIEDDGIDWGF